MSSFSSHPIAACVFLALVAPAAANSIEPVDSDPGFTVIVFNYAQVPEKVLAQAQSFAGKTFRRVGVRIQWIEPTGPVARREWDEAQNGSRLVMRILPDSMIGAWANQHDLLGFSMVPAGGGAGYIAGAYHERVQQLAVRLGGDPALLLGYVMAHELGHLLLGAHSHFRSGIMAYPFERKELLLASQGLLRFTPSQAKRIRERLRQHSQSLNTRQSRKLIE